MTGKLACIAASRIGKTLLTLWSLILAMIIVLGFADFFPSNIFGQIVVVVILVLFNASIIVTHIVKNGTDTIAKIVWTVLCVAVIVVLFTIPDPHHPDARRDTEILLIYSMLALTFPFGLLVPLILGVLDNQHWFDFGVDNIYVSNLIVWAGFFAMGYVQWFVLLPWLFRKWKSRRARKAALSI